MSRAISSNRVSPSRRIRAIAKLLGIVALLIMPGRVSAQDMTQIFDAEANYRILTRYGLTTEITLADYLATGVMGITFSLKSCDSTRADYYSTASVQSGNLVLESNTLGHVHGPNTQAETVCTVTGTDGNTTQDQEYRLYTVSDRIPFGLSSGALSLVEARANELDIRITVPESSSYVRLGWRKTGKSPTFRVVSGVSSDTVLTIPGLETGTEYEIRASLMTRQSFDLYRAGNSGPPTTLILQVTPAYQWANNLSGSGLGKSQTLQARTMNDTPPRPRPPEIRRPTLSIDDVTGLESDGELIFTVSLDAPGSRRITVSYATADGTARAGSDYTATSGTVIFAVGEVEQTIAVPVLDDALDEPDETFTVILSRPVNATLGDDEGTGTIVDDDDAPTLSIDDVTGLESDGELIFTVSLDAPGSRRITVSYATADGTARAGSDYTATSGTVIFAEGEVEQTIAVPVLDDALDEPDETFTVILSRPVNATLGDDEGTGTIVDADDAPTLSIDDVTGLESDGELIFTVSLDAPGSCQC